MPLTDDDRSEIQSLKSDIVHEVKTMNDAAKLHVERVVAPFTQLPKRVEEIETHNKTVQTPMLDKVLKAIDYLQGEAKKSRRARIASTKERIKRSALDADKRKNELVWGKRRRMITWALAAIVGAGEAYRAFFKDDESHEQKTHHEEPKK